MALVHPFYGISVTGLLYSTGREGLLDQTISYVSDTIRMGLIADTYVFDETHSTVADLGADVFTWSDQELQNKTTFDGYAGSDPAYFTAIEIPPGVTVRGYVLVIVAGGIGTDPVSTDRLLCFGDDTLGFSSSELGAHDTIVRPDLCGPFRAWFRV